jgi:hypothetical protein
MIFTEKIMTRIGAYRMDSVSTVEAALMAGAVASTKDIASQTVKDAYNSLKMELRRLFADKPGLGTSLMSTKPIPGHMKNCSRKC